MTKLKPQALKILKHLKQPGASISPMESLVVYGIPRLAASIYEIRKEGYNIRATLHRDNAGHKYARYSLED